MAGTVLPTWLILIVGVIVMGSLLLVCAWSEIKRCVGALFSRRAPDTVDQATPLLSREREHNNDHVVMMMMMSQSMHAKTELQGQHPSQVTRPNNNNNNDNNNNNNINNDHNLQRIPHRPPSILKTSINHHSNQSQNQIQQPPQQQQHHHNQQQNNNNNPNNRNPNQPRTQEQLTQHQKRLAARLQEHYANSSVQGTTTYQSTIDHQSVQAFHEEQGEPELSFEGSTGSLSSGAFSEGDLPSDDDNDDFSPDIRPDHVIAFDTTSTLLETMSALNSDVGYLSDGDVDLAAEITGYEVDESEDDQTLQPTNPESILDAEQSREKRLQEKQKRQQKMLQQANVALAAAMSPTQINTTHNSGLHQHTHTNSHQQHHTQQQHQTSNNFSPYQQQQQNQRRNKVTSPTTPTLTATTQAPMVRNHQIVDISPDNENIIPRQQNHSTHNPHPQQQQQQPQQQRHYPFDDTHSTHISLNNSLNDRVVASGSIVLDQKHALYHQHQRANQQSGSHSGGNASGNPHNNNNSSLSGNNPLSNHTPVAGGAGGLQHQRAGSIPKDRSSTTRNYHVGPGTNSPHQPDDHKDPNANNHRPVGTGGSVVGSNKQVKKVTINPKVSTFTNKSKNDYGRSLGYSGFDEDNMFGDLSDTSSVYTVNTIVSSKK